MRTLIKKKQAMTDVIPHLTWFKSGTLAKDSRTVPHEKILALVSKGTYGTKWKTWLINGRYYVMSTESHDVFYESEKRS